MTRRAKDENLEIIYSELETIEKQRGQIQDFTEELSVEEKMLVAWYHGWLKGLKDGRESEQFEQEFRREHNIKPKDPLPEPREMLRMIDKLK